MAEAQSNPDDNARTIVLVYGLLENGGPFWLFAAVRTAKYAAFLEAQKNGALDLHQFSSYGEIIVSGEGKSPPEEITLKVAELYQTPDSVLKDFMEKHENK